MFIFHFIHCIRLPFSLGLVFSLSDCLVSYLSLVGERMSRCSKVTIGHILSLHSNDEDVHLSGSVPLNEGVDGFLGKGAVSSYFRK